LQAGHMDAKSSTFHFQNPLKLQSNLCKAIISIQNREKGKSFPKFKNLGPSQLTLENHYHMLSD